MPRIVIDGRHVDAPENATVLEAASSLGIDIPTLCHHPDLKPVGSCRICCVEIEGSSRPQSACDTICSDGMQVRTESDELIAERREILEMLLADYDDAALHNSAEAGTEFGSLLQQYSVAQPTPMRSPRYSIDSDPNPFIRIDLNQCILCTRCVRACNEIQGRFVWGVADRAGDTRIVCGNDTTMLEARCESCGACAAYCPTGALDDRIAVGSGEPDRLVRTTCGYCGVGCQFDLNVKDDKLVRVTSTPEAPVNGMSLCVKGRYGFDFVHHADRVAKPRVRRYLLDGVGAAARPADRGEWVETSWDTALNLVAERFLEIRGVSGPQAFGVLASAKCTNEENFLMQKFSRQVLGTNNVDHCARLCHSSTVAGLAMAMGSGAMSNSMSDVAECAKAIFIIGSNTTEQHPVFGTMLRQAALRGTPIVVADPRRIDMTEFAQLHLRQRPGTDVALINGLMHLIIENNWHDEAFVGERCEGYAELQKTVQNYTPGMVSEITGVDEKELRACAAILGQCKPAAVIWSMGITQHTTGVSNVLSLANLQMLLGNMGVPGGGVNPLRGQNNVQGACDLGALPNVYSGYQRVDHDETRRYFENAWALQQGDQHDREEGPHERDVFALDPRPGLTVTELIDAAGSRAIRALYILGEDPAMTEPNSNHARQCLADSEFLVLQEIFDSETAVFADVLLPGCSFAEKHGTFTNTERRIQPIREAIPPHGESRPDWQITSDLAKRLLVGRNLEPQGNWASWDYAAAADVMREINAVTPSYRGATPERIENGDQLQWPIPSVEHPGTPILHVGKFTRGLGRFHAVDFLPPAELPDDEYPYLLTTGRVIYHWHGGELTRRAAALNAACPDPIVEVSPDDAARMNIVNGTPVTVTSRRGELQALARVTSRVSAGVLFANFHFPGLGNANNLTVNHVDPIAKIPEYKVCAVQLQKGPCPKEKG